MSEMFDDLDEIYFSDYERNPMKTPEIPVDYIKIDINKNVDDQKEKCELDDNVIDISKEVTKEKTGQKDYSDCVDIKITNIVTTIPINKRLNAHEIAKHCLGVKYKPRLNGTFMDTDCSGAKVIILNNAKKLVCTGAKTLEESERAFGYVSNKLKLKLNMEDIKIVNQTVSCDVRFGIQLTALSSHINIGKCHTYDPSTFCGLRWRFEEPKCTVTVYASGNTVFTGIKKEEDIYKIVDMIYPLLLSNKNIFGVVRKGKKNL